MQYIKRYLVNNTVYYTVYNARGKMALFTSNSALAHIVAESFQQNPHTEQIKILELDPDRVKRR